VLILEVDADRRRLSLSMKRVEGGQPSAPGDDGDEGGSQLTPNLGLSEEVFAEVAGAPAATGASAAESSEQVEALAEEMPAAEAAADAEAAEVEEAPEKAEAPVAEEAPEPEATPSDEANGRAPSEEAAVTAAEVAADDESR